MKHPLEPAAFCSLMRIESDVNVSVKVYAPIYVYAHGIWQFEYFDCRYSACVCQRVGCVESVGVPRRNMDFICAGPLLLTGTGLEVDWGSHPTHSLTHTLTHTHTHTHARTLACTHAHTQAHSAPLSCTEQYIVLFPACRQMASLPLITNSILH